MWFPSTYFLFIKRLQPDPDFTPLGDEKFDLADEKFIKVVKGIKLVSLAARKRCTFCTLSKIGK